MLEGVRCGNKPCTACGGPRDHTRKHPKFGVVANPLCRNCHSLRVQEWQAKHPDWCKAYSERNKHRQREYRMTYYRLNRDRLIAAFRAYRHKLNTEGIA